MSFLQSLLLFIIPGVVYYTNRLLAYQVLVLEGLDWLDQVVMQGEFSNEPVYDQTLSSFNLHAAPTVSLENYMQQASDALPSQVEE